jgi:hypothetical protein
LTDLRPDEKRPTETLWPWFVLLVAAALDTAEGLSNIAVLFDGEPDIPGTSPGGLFITATILLRPLLGIASIVALVRGRIPSAIMALAGIALLSWLSDLPSVVIHWPDPDLWGLEGIAHLIVQPLLAVAAIRLAWRTQWLGLAALLAILPTAAAVISVIAFTVGVLIYGF